MNRSATKILISLTLIALFSISPVCGKEKPKSFDPLTGPDPQWPPPPNPAKLKWTAMYADEYDLGAQKKSKFIDVLSGVKKSVFGLQRPMWVAADKEGRIFVADFHLGMVLLDPVAKKMVPMPIQARFKQITGVEVDDHFLYVADAGKGQVLIFDKQGNQVGGLGKAGEMKHPDQIALSKDGKSLWVVDTNRHQLLAYDIASRKLISTIGKRGGKPGEFNFPVGIAFLSNGDVVVSDFGNFRIQVLSPNGRPIKAFGKPGDLSGHFFRLKGVAVDRDDHIYAVDGSFSNIQVFDRAGQLLTIVGEPGARKGQFSMPVGICIKGDLVYVADQLNKRVQVIRYIGDSPGASNEPGKGPA